MEVAETRGHRVNVTVYDGGKELFTSVHGCKPGEHTYADLINSVAFRNENIVRIDPKNTFLEFVRDDDHVVTLKPSMTIDPLHTTLEMQIGLSRRVLVRATGLKDETNMLGKIANVMYLSLSNTDDLTYLAAGHKVGPMFVIWQFYLEFKTRRLHATLKSYFDNYFGVVSVSRSCARDASTTMKLFMSLQLEPKVDDGASVLPLALCSNGAYCRAVRRRIYDEKPALYGTVHHRSDYES